MKQFLAKIKKVLFEDKDGKITIWQKPNPLLTIWAAGYLVQKALPAGNAHDIIRYISLASLFVWAALELYSGASLFRKLVGLTVAIGVIATQARPL